MRTQDKGKFSEPAGRIRGSSVTFAEAYTYAGDWQLWMRLFLSLLNTKLSTIAGS